MCLTVQSTPTITGHHFWSFTIHDSEIEHEVAFHKTKTSKNNVAAVMRLLSLPLSGDFLANRIFASFTLILSFMNRGGVDNRILLFR
jgi:hypothetical protein